MNRKHLIIGLIVILAITTTTTIYGFILSFSEQNNDIIGNVLPDIDNNENNTVSVEKINSNNGNTKNNGGNNNGNGDVVDTGGGAGGYEEKSKDSVFKTSDGKPRTSHDQSGYSDLRQDLNRKADWIESNNKQGDYIPIKDDRGNVEFYINK